MNDQAASPVATATSAAPAKAPTAIDWAGMLPETFGEVVLAVLEVAVLWLAVANGYAIYMGADLTFKIKACGLVAALGLVTVWKLYLALVEAFGVRVLGATYTVLGVAACAVIQVFATTAVDVSEGGSTLPLIRVLGAAFLYPAFLGVMLMKDGKVSSALNPVGVPVRPAWFTTLWIIYAKEVRSFFTTAIPYVLWFIFMIPNGFLLYALLSYFTSPQAGETPNSPVGILFHNIFLWITLLFICPLLTMRLVAEEKRQGTVETLLTAPVTDPQVVLAKFTAAMTFFATMLVPTLVYIGMLSLHTRDWDWGPVFASYLSMACVGGLFIAIGLFWSTLTESQLIAGALAFVTNLVVFLLTLLVENSIQHPTVRAIFRYVSIYSLNQEMVRGVISTKTLVFFASGIAFFLFASVRGLESQKWR